MRFPFRIFTIALCLILLIVGCKQSKNGGKHFPESPVVLRYLEVSPLRIPEKIQVMGKVIEIPEKRTIVSYPEPGWIVQNSCAYGKYVENGHSLFTLFQEKFYQRKIDILNTEKGIIEEQIKTNQWDLKKEKHYFKIKKLNLQNKIYQLKRELTLRKSILTAQSQASYLSASDEAISQLRIEEAQIAYQLNATRKELETLEQSNILSLYSYKKKRLEYKSLMQIKKMEMAKAQEKKDRAQIKAPAKGVLVNPLRQPAGWFDQGQPLAKIIELDSIWIECLLSPQLVNLLQKPNDNGKVMVKFWLRHLPKQRFCGELLLVEPVAQTTTGKQKVRIVFRENRTKHPFLLLPNMHVMVSLPLQERKVFSVPWQSLRINQTNVGKREAYMWIRFPQQEPKIIKVELAPTLLASSGLENIIDCQEIPFAQLVKMSPLQVISPYPGHIDHRVKLVKHQNKPKEVAVIIPTRKRIKNLRKSFPGRVVAAYTVPITSRKSGILTGLSLNFGERVDEGISLGNVREIENIRHERDKLKKQIESEKYRHEQQEKRLEIEIRAIGQQLTRIEEEKKAEHVREKELAKRESLPSNLVSKQKRKRLKLAKELAGKTITVLEEEKKIVRRIKELLKEQRQYLKNTNQRIESLKKQQALLDLEEQRYNITSPVSGFLMETKRNKVFAKGSFVQAGTLLGQILCYDEVSLQVECDLFQEDMVWIGSKIPKIYFELPSLKQKIPLEILEIHFFSLSKEKGTFSVRLTSENPLLPDSVQNNATLIHQRGKVIFHLKESPLLLITVPANSVLEKDDGEYVYTIEKKDGTYMVAEKKVEIERYQQLGDFVAISLPEDCKIIRDPHLVKPGEKIQPIEFD